MDILMIGTIAATACGYLKEGEDRRLYANDRAAMINQLVSKKYGNELSQVKAAHRACQKDFDKFISAEKDKINALINTEEYRQSENAANAAKAKIDILKKSIKNFKDDQTSVAVGSGESAVAVSISNSSAKAKLESDLAEAEAQYKTNTDFITALKSQAKTSVISERSDEFYISEQALKDAKRDIDAVKQKMDSYERDLRANNTDLNNAAIIRNYSKAGIIGTAALKSALPAYILYKIWNDAIYNLKMLEVAKEAV